MYENQDAEEDVRPGSVPENVPEEVLESLRSGRALRVHTRDGEVVVCRVLSFDERELVYAALESSRPERYAVCDSTGFCLAWDAIDRVALTGGARARRAPRRAAGRSS
jgi:hypothetical protein